MFPSPRWKWGSWSLFVKKKHNRSTICVNLKPYKLLEKEHELTNGEFKNMIPEFSAGQCPSLACNAPRYSIPLLIAVLASSYVILSASSTLTRGIFCSNFFSLKNLSPNEVKVLVLLVVHVYNKKRRLPHSPAYAIGDRHWFWNVTGWARNSGEPVPSQRVLRESLLLHQTPKSVCPRSCWCWTSDVHL